MKKHITATVTLITAAALLIGCGATAATPSASLTRATASAFFPILTQLSKKTSTEVKAPTYLGDSEIRLTRDGNGIVTEVAARTPEAEGLIESYNFAGKSFETVIAELTELAKAAGYHVDDIDIDKDEIELELEPLQTSVETTAPLYSVTDYGVTDYGVTDYGKTDYHTTDYGRTDYNETDYGDSDYGR